MMEGKAIIKVEGHLETRWKHWFEGMEIRYEGEDTILSGPIKDESYLHGILNQIRDLNLKLVSVNPYEKNKYQILKIMKKYSLALIVFALSISMTFGQNHTQKHSTIADGRTGETQHRHSIGASLFMLHNLSSESAGFYLLTYGYQLSKKDRIFIEYNSWEYDEPMGTYGDSKEFYPGYIRTHGIGFGYQRFHWKGLFTTAQATPFFKQYHDEYDQKTQKGFQLYLQLVVGYRIEFFKKRFYVEPAYALKYWPVDTNIPADFAAIAEGTPSTIIEPSLNFGYKF
jgi:hypothetical protein